MDSRERDERKKKGFGERGEKLFNIKKKKVEKPLPTGRTGRKINIKRTPES